MATIITTNMLLPLPIVGQEAGPQFATDINNSLTIVDQHNHTSGSGVQIPPSGLNINTDLSFNGNNLTNARSTRFSSQSSPLALTTDLNCTYVSGVDLYYNDGNGNHVRITQSGAVAGSPGSISNLTSPASASFNNITETFVWQSAANTSANMDFASMTLRNLTAGSFGYTINPPTLSSNITVTLPNLPSSQKIMTLDNSGNISAPYFLDNATINLNGNAIQVKPLSIGPAQITANSITAGQIGLSTIQGGNIASGTIAGSNIASSTITTSNIGAGQITQDLLAPRTVGNGVPAGGVAISANVGVVTTVNPTAVTTGMAGSIVTTGRPVQIQVMPYPGTANSFIAAVQGQCFIFRNGTQLCTVQIFIGSTDGFSQGFSFLDVAAAGTYTYELMFAAAVGTTEVSNMWLVCYEI